MSNKTQLQTNNTALDGYIARINAAKETAASLPDAGSGGSGGGTISVTVNNSSMNPVYYWDANGTINNVASYFSQTVNALNGVLFYAQEVSTDYTGNYLNYSIFNSQIAMFLSDGGTMYCGGDQGSGQM